MPSRNFVKLWLHKIVGKPTDAETDEPVENPIPTTSNATRQHTKKQDPTRGSTNSKDSYLRSSFKETPDVLRASDCASSQIIPPLPRLCLTENTADKLSRVVAKFDSMTIGEEQPSDPSSTSLAPPSDKSKYE